MNAKKIKEFRRQAFLEVVCAMWGEVQKISGERRCITLKVTADGRVEFLAESGGFTDCKRRVITRQEQLADICETDEWLNHVNLYRELVTALNTILDKLPKRNLDCVPLSNETE